MPIWDVRMIDPSKISISLDREVKPYFEEIKMEDRRKLDLEILRAMGVQGISLDDLYKEFVELVEDRLAKADRPLKRLASEAQSTESNSEIEPDDEEGNNQ